MWKTEENCANPNFNAKSKPIPNRNLGEGGGGGGERVLRGHFLLCGS